MHAACVAATQRPPASQPAWRPRRVLSLSTRQVAEAFNQPLSFDTSSVTTINSMFSVRCVPLPPVLTVVGPSLHRRCTLARAVVAPRPLVLPARMPPLFCMPPLPTWQGAATFNLPLSFDTSSVTTMSGMFAVRSVPLPPISSRGFPLARFPLAPQPPYRPPTCRFVSLPLRLGRARRRSTSR